MAGLRVGQAFGVFLLPGSLRSMAVLVGRAK